MKAITKYKALDESVFDTEKECLEYEKICTKVDEIMKDMIDVPDTCDFGNGKGYIQQDQLIVDTAKTKLLSLGRKLYKSAENASFYGIGRWFDDSGNSALYHAWGRLSNCDSQYREWGQMYYALHPEQGKQIQLNK